MRSETLHAILPLAIILGLGLSIFAAVETLVPSAQQACSVSFFLSCRRVSLSGHTTTLGTPDWIWGVGGFAALLGLDVEVYRKGRSRWLDALTVVSGLGLALSVYLLYVELAIIQAVCLVCFGTYVANLIVLVSAVLLRRQPHPSPEPSVSGATT